MQRLSLFLFALLTACSSTEPSDVWQQQLDEARARWATSGPANYVYHYTRHCFCPQLSLRVSVTDGQVRAIHDLTADTAHVAPFDDYRIPKLFDQLQGYIDQPVYQLTVSYDPLTGIPLTVAADPIANAVDDENGFAITEFAQTP